MSRARYPFLRLFLLYLVASLIPPARIVPSLAFGPFGGPVGASWGLFCGSLETSWEPLGTSWGVLGGL